MGGGKTCAKLLLCIHVGLLTWTCRAECNILITEVNSTANSYASYVEICNNGSSELDISDYTISYWNDGNLKIEDRRLNADGYADGLWLSPGEYFLVLRSKSGFLTAYPEVVLNDGPDNDGNSSIEWMAHGWLYLNGGKDCVLLESNGGTVAVDRFLDGTDSWPDNHCFERVNYPNDGTALASHWRDLGENQPGTPGAGNDTPLPVTLSLFEVIPALDHIALRWRTESEVNNSHFNILRAVSFRGRRSTIAGPIQGSGNSSQPRDYQYVDRDVVLGRTYFYWLESVSLEGEATIHGPVFARLAEQNLDRSRQSRSTGPEGFFLTNYPNPFNPSTTISFCIPVSQAAQAETEVAVYDILGREVRLLARGSLGAGPHELQWDGTDQSGRSLPAGTYFCHVRVGQLALARRMTLLR